MQSQTRTQAWWDNWFLGLAAYISTASKDPSTQTGAVIARGKGVVSVGYNGFPAGVPDDDRLDVRETKYEMIIHCEVNAAIFAKQDLTGCTLYTSPFMSCSRCASIIVQCGITRVVAPVLTNPRWIESCALSRRIFEEAGVEVVEV